MIASRTLSRVDPANARLWPAGPSHADPRTRILLINHDENESNTLSLFLADSCEIFFAKNDYTIPRIIENNEIQLIITGIEPGNMEGSLLCSKLKSSPNYSHIPVVLVISKDSMFTRLKCLESGADAFIERPLSQVYIQAQIRNLIGNRMKIHEHYGHSFFTYPGTPVSSKKNLELRAQLDRNIAKYLSDSEFGIDMLAKCMNMSRPTLYRKVRTVSDLSPNELINIARLTKAADLISTTDHKIFEIAAMVGFHSRSNFGKAFFKQFHVKPTEYLMSKRNSRSPNPVPPAGLPGTFQ